MPVKVTGMQEFNQDLKNLMGMVSSKEIVDAVDEGWSMVTDQIYILTQVYLSLIQLWLFSVKTQAKICQHLCTHSGLSLELNHTA